MKPRTVIVLLIALVAGVAASLATYDMVRHQPHTARTPTDDADPGLTP